MRNESIDIIVPVWNRPVETRTCLVSLIENSPNIRLILVDNSCDRETEAMLGEFAEALDLKALFLKNRLNEGLVKGVNRGLCHAESRFAAVIRQNSKVRPGWLEPLYDVMMQSTDIGMVVPDYYDTSSKKLVRGWGARFSGIEVSCADFSGFLMRRSLLDSAGYFNEDMDGGLWCLKEYGRRVWRGGFRTCSAPESVVERSAEPVMGSASRRAEHEHTLRIRFRESWGEEQVYCIHISKGADLSCMNARLKLIATAARQGNRIILIPHPAITSELIRGGCSIIHEHVNIEPFSRFMPESSIRKIVSRFSEDVVSLKHVSWGAADDLSRVVGDTGVIAFSEFENIVSDAEKTYYGRTITF